eukprot:CAMPEP_0181139946 /NCGR_PEP_ID=MMETSP1071-20121207/35049_1 /TAXON_ID=35127 /ORGANISM="Thalassiosira sp., Strain NH16" /LENGTH=177 /DNA_ID=CAMNT_0023226879 /DNA_START=49 /DNA_END=582 /DNA_ORIENTATION=-
MVKYLTARLLPPLLLTIIPAVIATADPQPSSPEEKANKEIRTLMCTTESCTDSDEDTPGCKSYTTPLNTCYNAKDLFPNDESWSDLDIYDEMIMRNLKRSFYQSKDGSCAGRGEEKGDGGGGGATNVQPVDGDDSFTLPMKLCVGPFGPPRPWGKFTLLGDDDGDVEESEALSTERE